MLVLAAAGMIGGWLWGPSGQRPGGERTGEANSVFQRTCAACHGERGGGKRELGAPPIGNLPEWYVREQLGKFRKGWRGAEPRDVRGQQMRAAVVGLTDGDIAEAVEELMRFPFVRPELARAGDPDSGAVAYREQCMECHRYNGHGELAFKSAPLAGLPDWYLQAQMDKYRRGVRGYEASDLSGVKMREMAGRPANEREVADIIAFMTTLAEVYPVEKAGNGKGPNRSAR